MIACNNCRAQNRDNARFCGQCGARLPQGSGTGMVLGGEYRVVDVIKSGGMGTVYKAESRGKLYAVKEMRDIFTNPKERQDAINRFMAEALILARLSHPHIPEVHRHFIENERYYLVMDFIEGEDLQTVLDRQGGKGLPEEQVLPWALQICAVLEYLHGQNPPVIFRDLKPANVMLRPDGDIALIDFGIAKLFDPARQGTLIGTPGYAAPEQYQGLAEPRSDIFALGATLHHLLTSRDPQRHPPFIFPPVTAVNPAITFEMEAIIQKALQMNVQERWASIRDVKQALMSLAGRCQATEKKLAGVLRLTSTLSRENVLVTDQPQPVHVLLEMMPTEIVADVRVPRNLSLVVDTSSSMGGERTRQVKEAIKHVIDLLDDHDYISIIAFSDSTNTLVSSQQVLTPLEKDAFKRRVDMLTVGGSIVMAPAIRAGLSEIKKHWSAHHVSRLVLLCSGQTEGERECLKEADNAARDDIPIIALGVGTDWNEDLLDEIAEKSGGQCDFIAEAHQIGQHFQSAVQSMQAVVVQNAVLTLRLAVGVTLSKVWRIVLSISDLYPVRVLTICPACGCEYNRLENEFCSNCGVGVRIFRGTVTVPLCELAKNQSHALLLELMLSAWQQAGSHGIAQAEVVYDVPQLNLVREKVQTDITLCFTHDPFLAQQVNPKVMNIVEKVVILKL